MKNKKSSSSSKKSIDKQTEVCYNNYSEREVITMTVREFIDNNPEAIIEDNAVMEGSYYNDWISVDNALDRDILEVKENADGTFLIII